MIPSKTAETMGQALDILAAKNPSGGVKDAIAGFKRVIATYAGDADAFVPVDFTESDLGEGLRVFEAAARKDVSGYEGATRVPHKTFREGMNMAQDQKQRIKCRTTLILELIVVVVKKLP